MPEVARRHVHAHTAAHGPLVLVDDRREAALTATEAGEPRQPAPGRCWSAPLKGGGAAGVMEHLDPLRPPILQQSMTAGDLCNCPPRSRNRQQLSQRPLRSVNATNHVRPDRSEEYTSELQSRQYLVCRLLLEKKNKKCLTS